MTKLHLLAMMAYASLLGFAPGAAQAQAPSTSAPEFRDGSHDMDFNLGTWHTEITRFPDPFGDTSKIVHMTGTVTVRPVWNGKAQFEEIEADGPSGHWEGATMFLYDPQAHQWSQNFASASAGHFNPPSVGAFRNGNVEYYAADNVEGRAVLLRGTWSDIKPNSHSYEEDLSDDGGRTWHPAFIGRLNRISRRPMAPTTSRFGGAPSAPSNTNPRLAQSRPLDRLAKQSESPLFGSSS